MVGAELDAFLSDGPGHEVAKDDEVSRGFGRSKQPQDIESGSFGKQKVDDCDVPVRACRFNPMRSPMLVVHHADYIKAAQGVQKLCDDLLRRSSVFNDQHFQWQTGLRNISVTRIEC